MQPNIKPIIPGIVPAGGCCPSQISAITALIGTSKNTISDTTTGETRLRDKLNKVWPNNCAPIIKAPSKIHSFEVNPVKGELVKITTGKTAIEQDK